MKIGIIFGGPGNEREVSIKSAYNIEKFIDKKKFFPVALHWGVDGNFYIGDDIDKALKSKKTVELNNLKDKIDVAFLVTHGKYGEDGVLQSMLDLAQIKYTGCSVLSSSICMDKVVNKKIANLSKIPQVKFEFIDFKIFSKEKQDSIIDQVESTFKFPVFVKPSNSGSSVGITKVNNKEEIAKAIKLAKIHDTKVIIEEGVRDIKEVEVAVLGNSDLIISDPGELYVSKDFYDFNDKYVDGTSKQIIPANIDIKTAKEIKILAEKIYKLFECTGLARVDFFLSKNKIYYNEINTLPGFTNISMYPMLMDNMGIKYKDLITKIIKLAK